MTEEKSQEELDKAADEAKRKLDQSLKEYLASVEEDDFESELVFGPEVETEPKSPHEDDSDYETPPPYLADKKPFTVSKTLLFWVGLILVFLVIIYVRSCSVAEKAAREEARINARNDNLVSTITSLENKYKASLFPPDECRGYKFAFEIQKICESYLNKNILVRVRLINAVMKNEDMILLLHPSDESWRWHEDEYGSEQWYEDEFGFEKIYIVTVRKNQIENVSEFLRKTSETVTSSSFGLVRERDIPQAYVALKLKKAVPYISLTKRELEEVEDEYGYSLIEEQSDTFPNEGVTFHFSGEFIGMKAVEKQEEE